MGFEGIDILRCQYTFPVDGDLAVGDDQTLWLAALCDCEINELFAVVKIAPTGAAVILEIERSDDEAATWDSVGTVTIAAGSRTGETTGLSFHLNKNDLLRLNVDQIGSTLPGTDLTVFVRDVPSV